MLEKNLQALSLKNPSLAQRLLEHVPSGVDFDIAASGDYNIIYNNIHLHDTSDPQKEALLILGDEDNSDNLLQFVFGLGLGYLFKRTYISSKSYIVLYEPSMDVLKSTLSVVDFSNEISDDRVIIIGDISEIGPLFYKYIFENVKILHLSSTKELYLDHYDRAFFELNRFYLDQKTNINKSFQIAETFVGNLPYIVKYPPVTILKNMFKGKPALVVSAGPSLDKTIDIIKENRDKFLIIAIGQAVKALYTAGIIPDFVIVIDMLPMDYQINFLEDKLSHLNLVLQPAVHINMFKIETGTKFTYIPSPDFMAEWYANRMGYATLPQGNTVSICAFMLSLELGADPVILVGQDLAYSGGKVYASNTIYDSVKLSINDDGVKAYLDKDENNTYVLESQEADQQDKLTKEAVLKHNLKFYENTVKVKGQNGEMLDTFNVYAKFITQYSALVAELKKDNLSTRLINASEGGAYIEGFEHITLKEVILQLNESVNLNKLEIISVYNNNKPDKDKILIINQAFNRLFVDLRDLKDESQRLLKLSSRLQSELKLTNSINNKALDLVKQVQKIENNINSFNKGDRVAFIYPFVQKELFECNTLRNKTADNDKDKLSNWINYLSAFANAMIKAVDRHQNAFKNLSEFPFKE